MLGPRRKSEDEAMASGLAENIPDEEKVARPVTSAVVPTSKAPMDLRYPDASMLVPETAARSDLPEMPR